MVAGLTAASRQHISVYERVCQYIHIGLTAPYYLRQESAPRAKRR